MLHYIIRRLLYLIPIILGVAFVFFIIFNVVGGTDRVIYNIMSQKSRSQEDIQAAKHELGLDKPLFFQYLDYLRQIITFNFGKSLSQRQKISFLIKRFVPNSAILTFPAFFYELVISLILALICAFNRGKFIDKFLTVISVFGMSISMLVLILFGQKVLAYDLKLFPVSGWTRGAGQIRYLLLPWLLWVLIAVGYDIRFFRTTFIEEVNKDYVRTARAKGVSFNTIMFKHVFKNALIPILTYVVIAIPFLLTGSFLLERFFSIPGIGFLTVAAVQQYDLSVLKAMVIVYTLFFVVFNLITDILYALVDPRVRLS